jgi:hypothetical protein
VSHRLFILSRASPSFLAHRDDTGPDVEEVVWGSQRGKEAVFVGPLLQGGGASWLGILPWGSGPSSDDRVQDKSHSYSC